MKNPSRHFEILLSHLFAFQPVKDGADESWHFFTPDPHRKKRWLPQDFTKYQNTIYWTINLDLQLEFDLKKRELQTGARPFHGSGEYDVSGIIRSCIATLQKAKKDWLNYQREFLRSLPKQYRFGLIQRRILWKSWPDIYRPDLLLTHKERKSLTRVFDEQGGLSDKLALPSAPSLGIYLDYCRIAYLANFKKYKSNIRKDMTGMEMYKAMADGRHEGLIEISPDSAQALKEWYLSRAGGGHPWEICRGGNTTHIDLGMYHENDRWFIFLEGNSIGRMVETARVALAFSEKKMPFRWFRSNDVRLKMEGRDNIGIIPEFHSLHRAHQLFEDKDRVFDCIHWDDLGPAKKKIRDFVTWLPIDPLYPKKSV